MEKSKHPQAKRILVLLDYCSPGEAYRILFCLPAIRAAYPETEIVLLVGGLATPVVPERGWYDRRIVSHLYEKTAKSLWRLRLKKLWELARLTVAVGRGYDLAITLGPGSTLLKLLGWYAANRSIGYTHAIPPFLSSGVDYGSDGTLEDFCIPLLDAAGVSCCTPSVLSIYGARDIAAVERLLREQGLEDYRNLVVLHPGSDWACQQWAHDRWAALADLLIEDFGATVVFTGASDECSYVDAIREKMSRQSAALAGKTTLPELQALLAGASACICVDSAAHELARGANARTIVLAGATDTSRPAVVRHVTVLLNRMAPDLRKAINRCKEPKGDVFGGCLDYRCPMAGLTDIDIPHVIAAIESSGALYRTKAVNLPVQPQRFLRRT